MELEKFITQTLDAVKTGLKLTEWPCAEVMLTAGSGDDEKVYGVRFEIPVYTNNANQIVVSFNKDKDPVIIFCVRVEE